MVPWDKIAGGVLGAAAGATSSSPYGGKPFEGRLFDDKATRDYAGRSLTRAEGWASGDKPIQSQATINRLTSGSRARLGSAAAQAHENANERWIASGEGPASGSLDRRHAEIDRSLIDAQRQQEAPLLGQMAMREPEFQMQAQGMMMPWLQHAEQMSFEDWQRLEQMKAAKQAAGSALHRALAGGAAGFGGNYGGQGASFGAGGSGGAVPDYSFNEPDWGSYGGSMGRWDNPSGGGQAQSPDPHAWTFEPSGYDSHQWAFGGQG